MNADIRGCATSGARDRKIREIYRCAECGAVRYFVHTGLVCPNGHGKVVPIADPTIRRMLKARKPVSYADPVARARRPWQFTIEGLAGRFRFAPRGTSAGIVLARVRGRVRKFVPFFPKGAK